MAGLCVLRIEVMDYIQVAELYLTFERGARAERSACRLAASWDGSMLTTC